MSRTTAEAVEALLAGNYSDGIDLSQFIAAATLLVDRVETCATGRGVSLTAAETEMIERYLAAHFYGTADPFFASKSTGGASGAFQGQTQMGLNGTAYGQAALSLDPSGCLLSLTQGGKRIQVSWLGLPVSEQTDYKDRD